MKRSNYGIRFMIVVMVILGIVFGAFNPSTASAAPATTASTPPPPTTVNVYVNPSKVSADTAKVTVSVLATNETGPLAGAPVKINGTNAGNLNGTGGLTTTLATTTTAGSYTGIVEVGNEYTLVYTPTSGDCLWCLAGEWYPGQEVAQANFVEANSSTRLVVDVPVSLTMVPYGQSFTYQVVAGAPASVELTTEKSKAGEKPSVSGYPIDSWSNKVTQPVTITGSLDTTSFTKTGVVEFSIVANRIYTVAGDISFAMDLNGITIIDGSYTIVPAAPSSLVITGTQTATADADFYKWTVTLADRYGNLVSDVPVTVNMTSFTPTMVVTTTASGPTNVTWTDVQTRTGNYNMTFKAAGLKATWELVIEPGPVVSTTVMTTSAGAYILYAYDAYENPVGGYELPLTMPDGTVITLTSVLPPSATGPGGGKTDGMWDEPNASPPMWPWIALAVVLALGIGGVFYVRRRILAVRAK